MLRARPVGVVTATRASALEASLPAVRLGDAVRILSRDRAIRAHVDAIEGRRVVLVPHDPVGGIAAGDRVEADPSALALPLGLPLLGRAVDPAGEPLDGGPPPRRHASVARTPLPCERRAIDAPLWTFVPAIDGLLTIGKGARIGIFGPPGAGKSTLLEQISHNAEADAVVVALVGERGREAETWLRRLDARTSVVCATSDRGPAERARAADAAFAQAESLREKGVAVLLIVDSLARVGAALREIALARGEAPGRGGYPPSVFASLAKLVERAGRTQTGSVTLIATILCDDEPDPLADAGRSLLDGHVVLDRGLAEAGKFPAIDVPRSASRTMDAVVSNEHRLAARRVRAALAALRESADLRATGLYQAGADPAADRAVAAAPGLERFLYEDTRCPPGGTLDRLFALADTL